MKYLLSLIFILLLGLSVSAQKKKSKPVVAPRPPGFDYVPATAKCSLKSENFGAIRGLKLGMTVDQVKEIFLTLDFVSDESSLIQTIIVLPKGSEFSGIRGIAFEFFENKAVSFFLSYEHDIEWNSIAEFRMQVSSAMKLPTGIWSDSIDIDGTGVSAAECQDFKVLLSLLNTNGRLGYSVRVEKNNFRQEAQDKVKADKEKQKKQFKP